VVAAEYFVMDSTLHALDSAVLPDHLLANQEVIWTDASITKSTIDAPVSISYHTRMVMSERVHET
jgi:hypothetical protein